jgi:hypothetical protein
MAGLSNLGGDRFQIFIIIADRIQAMEVED